MNDLEKYFRENTGRLIDKWHHYFDIYDRYFSKFRDKEIVLLEIGLFQGGSLQMWRDYFGDKVKIYGIDINEDCKQFEDENTKVFIGSQSDRKFLREVFSEIPPIDVFIDDGGHTMKQQIVSFEEGYRHIKEGGVYLCEDLHTSYWSEYGGGYKRGNSFIEYSKNWIDSINAYHSRTPRLKVNDFTKTAKSLHYYDSMVVIEKGRVDPPNASRTGVATVKEFSPRKKNYIEKGYNIIMSKLNLPFFIE